MGSRRRASFAAYPGCPGAPALLPFQASSCRLRSWPRRVSHPGLGPARADPVPAGGPHDHRPPQGVGVPARNQRAPGVGGGGGAGRGLRADLAWAPGAAPGREGPSTERDTDRPPGRVPDGRPGRESRRSPRHISLHSLRHAAITNALDAGVPLRDAQILARHADPHHRALRPRPRQRRPARRAPPHRLRRRRLNATAREAVTPCGALSRPAGHPTPASVPPGATVRRSSDRPPTHHPVSLNVRPTAVLGSGRAARSVSACPASHALIAHGGSRRSPVWSRPTSNLLLPWSNSLTVDAWAPMAVRGRSRSSTLHYTNGVPVWPSA